RLRDVSSAMSRARWQALRVGFAPSAVLVVALVASACTTKTTPGATSGRPTSGASPVAAATAGSRHSSRRLILGGRVRCTAKLTAQLQPGHPTGMRFVLRNISKHTVKAVLTDRFRYGLVLHTTDGVSYDTAVPLRGESGPAP